MSAPTKRRPRFGLTPRWQGVSVERCGEPHAALEKRFAKAFQQWNRRNGRTEDLLATLLAPEIANSFASLGRAPRATLHDSFVAATVVQWLGSRVGLRFLSEVLEIPIEDRHQPREGR